MRYSILIIVFSISSLLAYSQGNKSIIRTRPISNIIIEFFLTEYNEYLMAISMAGGKLSQGAQTKLWINGGESSTDFTYVGTAQIDLTERPIELYLDSASLALAMDSSVCCFRLNRLEYWFTARDQDKIKQALKKCVVKQGYSDANLRPFIEVDIGFGIDEWNEPVVSIRADFGKLSTYDTLGFQIKGSEYVIYQTYEDWPLNIDFWAEELVLDQADIDLIIKNGLNYIYVNDFVFFFDKDDKKEIARLAKSVFER